MSGEVKRTDRIGQLVQEELGKVLVEGNLKDPRIGFTTVTEVRVSKDLRTARVYVSIYGDEEKKSASMNGLQAAAGFLKRELGVRLRMKSIPDLTFVRDETLDKAERIDAVLGAIAEGASEPPPKTRPDLVPVDLPRVRMEEPPELPNPPKPAGGKRRRRRNAGRRRR